MTTPRRAIKSQTLEELQAELQSWNEPAYRASQIIDWLYPRRATAWEQMSNLPRRLRERLAQHYALTTLEEVTRVEATDATRKFLWRLPDRAMVESVLIPANPALYGEASDRHTLCVSTQVGCAYGCRFCASGLDGWKRNLGPDEIVDQVLAVERWQAISAAGPKPADAADATSPTEMADVEASTAPASPSEPARKPAGARLIDNLVIMGMGEPLANYDNLLRALRILNAPWGGGIGARKITISTSGLCPQIRRLAAEPNQFRLAISLHGATDEVRNRLMPVNRKYPLAELINACESYQSRKGRMITFEYILIAGVNDSLDQVPPLADLARRVHARVNLIPYNRVEGLDWERPTEAHQEAFLAALEARGITATLRREKGHDIAAACGQLRLRTERSERDTAAGATTASEAAV